MNPFKKKFTPNDKHELAFEIEGRKFYFLKDESEFMKYPRWEAVSRYKELYQIRFTPDIFDDFLGKIEEFVNQGQLGMIGHIVQEAKVRSKHLTDVEAMYHFAAQYFFEHDEELSKILTPEKSAERIALFKKKPLLEFISLQPISDFIYLTELLKMFSPGALEKRMKIEKSLKAGLNKLVQGDNL